MSLRLSTNKLDRPVDGSVEGARLVAREYKRYNFWLRYEWEGPPPSWVVVGARTTSGEVVLHVTKTYVGLQSRDGSRARLVALGTFLMKYDPEVPDRFDRLGVLGE